MSNTFIILEPSGILDGVRGNHLRQEISNIINSGTNIVLIDMKEVKFIDSSGLGSLVLAMQMARNANAKLFVCSINDQVRMLFELTKVDRIFQIFVDQDDFKSQMLTSL